MFRSRLLGVVVLAVRYWDEDLKVRAKGRNGAETMKIQREIPSLVAGVEMESKEKDKTGRESDDQ